MSTTRLASRLARVKAELFPPEEVLGLAERLRLARLKPDTGETEEEENARGIARMEECLRLNPNDKLAARLLRAYQRNAPTPNPPPEE
ncbi:MAG: hypothetical protein Q7J47_06030 [Azoarcus sp.]|nr:hypothetical protein [Azoarcus sp.]